jgi:proline iminopeptidase
MVDMSPAEPYPEAPLLRTHSLPASGGHVLHVQEFGSAEGHPALVLHGGPGSGSSPLLRRFFDPARYRIICPDQRGAGASGPRGQTAHNTTQDLLDDLCALRRVLGLQRWLVVGGSWGATLALAYAAVEPHAATALLLRASFLARREDIDDFFQRPAAADAAAWQEFASVAPREHRHALLTWLVQVFDAGSHEQQVAAALAWWRWEQWLSYAGPAAQPPEGDAVAACVARYRVQAHYMSNACWLEAPSLLERCDAVPRVPTLLLHSSDDRICRPDGARALHRRLPHSRLSWVSGAGHNPAHPAMAAAMRAALEHYARHADFDAAEIVHGAAGRSP